MDNRHDLLPKAAAGLGDDFGRGVSAVANHPVWRFILLVNGAQVTELQVRHQARNRPAGKPARMVNLGVPKTARIL